jgi:hypothetical protein
MKAEKEKEEEEEELEVLGTVVGDDDKDDEMATRTTGPREIEEVEMSDVDEDEDEETDSEDEDGKQEEQTQKSLWRKSLERIIPWSLGGSIVETEVGVMLLLFGVSDFWFRTRIGKKKRKIKVRRPMWLTTRKQILWNCSRQSNLPQKFWDLS